MFVVLILYCQNFTTCYKLLHSRIKTLFFNFSSRVVTNIKSEYRMKRFQERTKFVWSVVFPTSKRNKIHVIFLDRKQRKGEFTLGPKLYFKGNIISPTGSFLPSSPLLTFSFLYRSLTCKGTLSSYWYYPYSHTPVWSFPPTTQFLFHDRNSSTPVLYLCMYYQVTFFTVLHYVLIDGLFIVMSVMYNIIKPP